MSNEDTYFTTGCDEHGLKVIQEATANNSTPERFCREMSSKYIEMCELFNISYNEFIRTTDNTHEMVKSIFI